MTEQKQTNARGGHLTVYLAWPVLAGLALAVVLATSLAGLVLVFSEFDWRAAGIAAAVTFFGVLGVATIAVFAYAAREFGQTRHQERLERMRQYEAYEPEPPPEPEIRFIPTGGRRRLNERPPALPSGGEASRAGVRAAISHLLAKLTATATVHELAADVQTIEPSAPGWCVEFYTVLTTVWPTQSLSRRTFEGIFGVGPGKKLWARYVNGTGSRHSQKGIWDTWGIVAKDGPRGSWQWTQPLDVIFSLDADLHRYATDKAGLVQRHSPAAPVSPSGPEPVMGQTRPGQRTGPEDQTKGGVSWH